MVPQAASLFALLQTLPADSEFLTFGRAPSFEPEAIEVRVGSLWRGREAPRQYWFERIGTAEGVAPTHAWTTTADCPAAEAVLARYRSIEMPSFNNPRTDGMFVSTFDGASYTFETSAYYGAEGHTGTIRLESNVRTSLAIWVDDMLATLQSCWSSRRPAIE